MSKGFLSGPFIRVFKQMDFKSSMVRSIAKNGEGNFQKVARHEAELDWPPTCSIVSNCRYYPGASHEKLLSEVSMLERNMRYPDTYL